MSRELKRVAVEFDWPLKKVWSGYVNPYIGRMWDCDACGGTGLIYIARVWSDMFLGVRSPNAFRPEKMGSKPFVSTDPFIVKIIRRKVEANPDSLMASYYTFDIETAIRHEAIRMCQIWNNSWGHHLDQDDVQALFEGGRLTDFGETCPRAEDVNRWSLVGMGHDAINEHICLKARMRRMGVEDYYCPLCKGEGDYWPDLADKEKYEKWEPVDPPAGEGWQLWETVSEGAPVSPVFEQASQLVDWLVGERYSRAAAEKFIEVGFAPSAMMIVTADEVKMRRDIESLG